MNQTKFFQKKTNNPNNIRLFFFPYRLMLSGLLFLAFGCVQQPREVTASFYHWKSPFHLTASEKKYCEQLKVQKLYVRLFDVDWDETTHFPTPVGAIESFAQTAFEIIPTVFITNKTFLQLPDNQIDTLARLVFHKINSYTDPNTSQDKNAGFNEIQIDCDWTGTTRDRFFAFLKKLKTLSNKKISATIRLHQVKFKDKTGVPPVDAGVLMVYNMGNLEDTSTKNSILDVSILKTYITNLKKYPIKLDIALPIFSWGVVTRDGEVVKLINNLDDKQILATPLLQRSPFGRKESSGQYELIFKKLSNNHFEILKNTYLKGYYLYKDDQIRIENTADNLGILEQSADLISKNLGILLSKWKLISLISKTYQVSILYIEEWNSIVIEKECQLLEYLMRHPGQLLTHEQIHKYLWNEAEKPSSKISNRSIRLLAI